MKPMNFHLQMEIEWEEKPEAWRINFLARELGRYFEEVVCFLPKGEGISVSITGTSEGEWRTNVTHKEEEEE